MPRIKRRYNTPRKSHIENQNTKTYLTDFRCAFIIMAFQFFILLSMQGASNIILLAALQLASIVVMYATFELIRYADAIPDETSKKKTLENLVILFAAMVGLQAVILVACIVVQNIFAALLTIVIIVEIIFWMRKHIEITL